jgi:hypothetical protein
MRQSIKAQVLAMSRGGDTGLNGALEIPALHRLLPNLPNLYVLDLGCGFDEFARFARTQGAASVSAYA